MKKLKKCILLSIVSFLVISCGNDLIHEDNAELTKKDGKMVFQGKLYNGELAQTSRGNILRIYTYDDGYAVGFKQYDRKYEGDSEIEIDDEVYGISDPFRIVTSKKAEEFYEDGSLKVSGSVRWEEGRMIRTGTWTQYDVDGSVKDTKVFEE